MVMGIILVIVLTVALLFISTHPVASCCPGGCCGAVLRRGGADPVLAEIPRPDERVVIIASKNMVGISLEEGE
jgi:hypothetical protein